MGLIDSDELLKGNVKYHQRYCPWANVIFDHNTKPALEHIWTYLNQHGLIREDDDCQPMTNWRDETNVKLKSASLVMAGRYGQWKYFWTDDCVLRGRNIMNSGFLQQID